MTCQKIEAVISIDQMNYWKNVYPPHLPCSIAMQQTLQSISFGTFKAVARVVHLLFLPVSDLLKCRVTILASPRRWKMTPNNMRSNARAHPGMVLKCEPRTRSNIAVLENQNLDSVRLLTTPFPCIQ